MKGVVPVKIFLLAFLGTLQMSSSISAPNGVGKESRIERSDANFSEHPQDGTEESKTPVLIDSEHICGPPITDSSDDARKRRSELLSFNASQSNGTSLTTTEDYSHLSDEFLNCNHIFIIPECYELLPNGSAYVPLYGKVFNRSNYFINADNLYICPKFFEEMFSKTTEDTRNVSDNSEIICAPPITDSSDSGRKKRSAMYSFNASMLNETSLATTEDYSYLSAEFLNCTSHTYLEPGCYEILPNESVYVPEYNMVFNRSNHMITDGLLLFCPTFFGEPETPTTGNGDKHSDHTAIISIVGASISTVCLVLHIIVYFSIKTEKNLPSRCLLSLCIALLGAYMSYFVAHAADDDTWCRIVGMSMVFFFLAAFYWMNVFSYDVWRSIRLATTKLRLTADRPMMVRFARYSLYAWGSPTMIVIVSVIIHNSTTNVKYQLIFGKDACWFDHKEALTLYFAGPLFALLGINILFTASSFFMISTATMKNNCSKVNFDIWSRFLLSLRLGSSMGLMWIFGVIAIVTGQSWLWYLFAICSSLQGVFIFFSFTLSERSRKECRKAIQSKKFSTMKTQVSSQMVTAV